jgi:hypothetical protein
MGATGASARNESVELEIIEISTQKFVHEQEDLDYVFF